MVGLLLGQLEISTPENDVAGQDAVGKNRWVEKEGGRRVEEVVAKPSRSERRCWGCPRSGTWNLSDDVLVVLQQGSQRPSTLERSSTPRV